VVSPWIFAEATDETTYQENSWGKRRPVRRRDDLTTFIVPKVEKIRKP
jgi:hypothetical protein